MISDARLCQLCADAYTEPLTFESAGVSFRVTHEDGYNVIAFRGSVTIEDWIRDCLIAPWHGTPAGFAIDVQQAWALVPSIGNLILTGHSKGATDAQLMADWFVSYGKTPAKLTTFGTPRLVDHIDGPVAKALQTVPGADYRNGSDPVTQLPPGYYHPRPIVQLGECGTIWRRADHHIGAYLEAMRM